MIYLDNAATSFPKPESVYQELDRFARTSLANPGRGRHDMAQAAEHALDNGRHLLNQLFHGQGTERFAFTFNCTDALNMALKGTLNEGDHVITSVLEHNSVSRPLRALELAGRIQVTRLVPDAGGTLDPDDVKKAITPHTRLVALTHCSNVIGTVQPVAEIGAIVRERDLLFLVDAAQTAGVLPIDVQAMHIDLLAFPGHKSLFGPTGTGALYVGPRTQVRPWREGGTGGNATFETQPAELPHHLEGGTPNVLGIAGLSAGIEYVRKEGLDKIHRHETDLVERLWQHLDRIGGFTVFGHRDHARRVGTISFRSDFYDSEELGTILNLSKIAVRSGLHCAPGAHRVLGTLETGTVRVSPGPFNSTADIDALAEAIAEVVKI